MPMQRIDNGVTLSYDENGTGLPLVLLHGFPLDRRVWQAQLDALSRVCRVITVDLRGFGQSADTSGQRFTLRALAGEVHEFLRQINALPCVLAGLSMGGYVALEFTQMHPTDLKGLVLVDTKAEGDTAEAKHARQEMADLARTQGAKAVGEKMMPKMLADATHRTNPALVQQLRRIMESCPPRTIEQACLAMRDRHDHTANLASIPVPVMIIVGESDAIIPVSLVRKMEQQIPRCQVEVIPNAGHLTPMEQPTAVNAALERFVASLQTA